MNTSTVDGLRWIDNHAHLDENAEDALAAANRAGVVAVIDVGCDLATSTACVARAELFAPVAATVGVHPHEARHGIDGIAELAENPTVVAIGECGLDYYYDHSPRNEQADAFAAQIELAQRLDLPLVIHTRDSWADTFAILDDSGVPGHTIFHCFTGGPAEMRACLDRGAWVSFSGIVTFKSATDVAEAARLCPDDRFLIETDSPYLAPVPHRGKTNHPAWVHEVGVHLAQLRSVAVGELATQAMRNTLDAYPKLGITAGVCPT